MEIILLEKIANLGAMGEKVNVKPGFGRNYLIPQGKAAPATAENIAEYEARRADLEKAAADALAAAQARRELLVEKVITITSKAGDEGKLFGSVGTADIAAVITEQLHPLNVTKCVCLTGLSASLASTMYSCSCTRMWMWS